MGPQIAADTIAAVATPAGSGGIAVIRMSGPGAPAVLARCWRGAPPRDFRSHTVHLGWIVDAGGAEIDQVLATLFRSPRSYTGEDVVEISVHGSPWIQRAVLHRLVECGARAAAPGEFTRRAFMNGRLDLAQAEGVADLIAASSRAAARLAASQLRGDFSRRLEEMRGRLVDLGSLLELELDFSEEDVEFADRGRLVALTEELRALVGRLASSYKAGNAFKNGIPVAIAGIPNAGKSTLLNALIGEEKAIVSDIPGTTRDVIEDTVEIGGILFRFYDTAGLRESDDVIENLGVQRARRKIEEAAIVLHLIDPTQPLPPQLSLLDPNSRSALSLKRSPESQPDPLLNSRSALSLKRSPESGPENIDLSRCVSACTKAAPLVLTLLTKSDLAVPALDAPGPCISLSAATGEGLDALRERLVALATAEYDPQQELIVTNARHYEALRAAGEALARLAEGLDGGLSADFLAQDLREATHHLGEITGRVTSEDLLQTIFARYCIGK